ncbi:senescence-specific cysteine protease sag39 [Cucumis melo var. makuwa]|uniref:Senescence-specific cysteine protease sag39 n=1 Tax=Cucumis melo var. makuwa TaxID=1194695 RepID=A0A5A7UN84_CUCMM|nr:senescence-specific cysteine protease sag39 [Cucumis melo var. makuwa]TYK04623.1 senescence-specific cysteine protease sag39 [Cucumis melo var. makuwa]
MKPGARVTMNRIKTGRIGVSGRVSVARTMMGGRGSELIRAGTQANVTGILVQGKVQRDRLIELEEQMLYLAEVPNSIRFLEFRLEEIAEKIDTINAVAGRVEGLPIQELLARVGTLKGNVGRNVNYEYEDTTLDVVRNEIVDVNARPNFTVRAIANQAPVGGAIPISRIKIPKPKPFCEARDARALENYIFYLEQYFRATNMVSEEAKVTLMTMHLFEAAKLWWRSDMWTCKKDIAR